MWPARLEQWRSQVNRAAEATGLDPTLIAAILDRESLGGVGLRPPGPSGTGDGGFGLGLMQLDRRYHPDLTDAEWQDPAQNILLGALELRQNLDTLDQNMLGAIAAYNASIERVERLIASMLDPDAKDFDQLTTGRNYVSDVLERKAALDAADGPPQPEAA